jgi:hypothetical protein
MDQQVVAELKRLQKANGGHLTAEQVVEQARDESSPLHAHLTWDDNEAAAKYRLIEARDLIRRVRVHIVPQGPRAELSVRPVMVSTPEPVFERYAPLVAAPPAPVEPPRDPLAEALAELQKVRARFADQAELRGVFAEMDRVLTAKMSPAAQRDQKLKDAVAFARNLESTRGLDRQSAAERAAMNFGVTRSEVVERLRKAG